MKNKHNYYKFVFILYFSVTYLSAENTKSVISKSKYGQNIFKKKLRHLCGRTAINFAQMNTAEEWKTLKKSNGFRAEIHKICSKSIDDIKKEWVEPLYIFAVMYARDTKKYTK